jgi:hypothetical protein
MFWVTWRGARFPQETFQPKYQNSIRSIFSSNSNQFQHVITALCTSINKLVAYEEEKPPQRNGADRVYRKVRPTTPPTTPTPIHPPPPPRLLEALYSVTQRVKVRQQSTPLSRAKPVRTTMNNRRSALIVFLLRHPQILEGRQRRQNRSTDPHRVLALWRCHNLHLHACRRQARQLLLHAVRNTWVHRSTARQHNVAVQVTTDVEVALVDRVVPATASAPNPMSTRV